MGLVLLVEAGTELEVHGVGNAAAGEPAGEYRRIPGGDDHEIVVERNQASERNRGSRLDLVGAGGRTGGVDRIGNGDCSSVIRSEIRAVRTAGIQIDWAARSAERGDYSGDSVRPVVLMLPAMMFKPPVKALAPLLRVKFEFASFCVTLVTLEPITPLITVEVVAELPPELEIEPKLLTEPLKVVTPGVAPVPVALIIKLPTLVIGPLSV